MQPQDSDSSVTAPGEPIDLPPGFSLKRRRGTVCVQPLQTEHDPTNFVLQSLNLTASSDANTNTLEANSTAPSFGLSAAATSSPIIKLSQITTDLAKSKLRTVLASHATFKLLSPRVLDSLLTQFTLALHTSPGKTLLAPPQEAPFDTFLVVLTGAVAVTRTATTYADAVTSGANRNTAVSMGEAETETTTIVLTAPATVGDVVLVHPQFPPPLLTVTSHAYSNNFNNNTTSTNTRCLADTDSVDSAAAAAAAAVDASVLNTTASDVLSRSLPVGAVVTAALDGGRYRFVVAKQAQQTRAALMAALTPVAISLLANRPDCAALQQQPQQQEQQLVTRIASALSDRAHLSWLSVSSSKTHTGAGYGSGAGGVRGAQMFSWDELVEAESHITAHARRQRRSTGNALTNHTITNVNAVKTHRSVQRKRTSIANIKLPLSACDNESSATEHETAPSDYSVPNSRQDYPSSRANIGVTASAVQSVKKAGLSKLPLIRESAMIDASTHDAQPGDAMRSAAALPSSTTVRPAVTELHSGSEADCSDTDGASDYRHTDAASARARSRGGKDKKSASDNGRDSTSESASASVSEDESEFQSDCENAHYGLSPLLLTVSHGNVTAVQDTYHDRCCPSQAHTRGKHTSGTGHTKSVDSIAKQRHRVAPGGRANANYGAASNDTATSVVQMSNNDDDDDDDTVHLPFPNAHQSASATALLSTAAPARLREVPVPALRTVRLARPVSLHVRCAPCYTTAALETNADAAVVWVSERAAAEAVAAVVGAARRNVKANGSPWNTAVDDDEAGSACVAAYAAALTCVDINHTN